MRDSQDLLGEQWLLDHDPHHTASPDFDRRVRAIGLLADLDNAAHRHGRLVEHGAEPITAILCARCHGPFEPYKNNHRFCGDLCRAAHRRDYQRDLMRQRRAA